MTELPVGTGAESLYVCIARTCIENRFEINRKHILMADLIVVHFLHTLRSDRRPMANEPR